MLVVFFNCTLFSLHFNYNFGFIQNAIVTFAQRRLLNLYHIPHSHWRSVQHTNQIILIFVINERRKRNAKHDWWCGACCCTL